MITYDLIMTKTEVKTITLRARDLQSGEAVDDAVITHTPPSGDGRTIEYDIDSPYINMEFGPFESPGYHFVKVQAAGELGSKPEALYLIRVRDA
jgi:hypothetical protein